MKTLCASKKVVYVLLSEFNKPFGIVTMSEEMSTAMGIEEGILQNNYSYNKLGTFDDSDDIKNRWKEIWDLSQQNKGQRKNRMRKLNDVIDQILEIAPELEDKFRSLKESVMYTAPEAMQDRWWQAAAILENNTAEHEKLDELIAIFNGQED